MVEVVDVVLCGGGIKGAFQAGFLYALLESGKYEIDNIYAVSVGALIAPLLANKRKDLIKDMFFNLQSIEGLFNTWPKWYFWPKWITMFFKLGLYQTNKIAQIIWDKLSNQEKIVANKKCHIVTWNLTNQCEEWFSNEVDLDDFLHGLIASSNLWLLVPPYKFQHDYYIDGGACNLFPIEFLLKEHTKENKDKKIFIIDNSTRQVKEIEQLPKNAVELMYHLHSTVLEQYSSLKMRNFIREYKNTELIRPEEEVFTHNMEFNASKIKKCFFDGSIKYKKFEKSFFNTILHSEESI